jgi:hypothetical protein
MMKHRSNLYASSSMAFFAGKILGESGFMSKDRLKYSLQNNLKNDILPVKTFEAEAQSGNNSPKQ